MNDPTPSRDEELFNHALGLPATLRDAYLERTCAGDTDLLKRVRTLLRAHQDASLFLEKTAPGMPSEPSPGEKIGRYKLLQKIGEGGCGAVYMAEQQEPVVRRVALKVIKLGMDTKAVIARFEAERQALALMDHPNIAKVLDGGATAAGRPYFVMELVRGLPITRFCDEQSLPTAARLELFTAVCHAVQHAHQKGVIHRDLKPSNILVTLHDGVPVPKVIDFGIAKATQGKLTDSTLFTAFEQFIGTPAYMSPEQAEMSGLDIDTRSDIYSLGVLLYELLTGQPPFDAKSFLVVGLDEMRRMIREVEPPRPSTRLATLADADRSTIAKLRATAPAQLRTTLAGDLDWIVMKSLEKNRTRRYETASELAADLRRHLANEPVLARPPSAAYRLGKALRRHRLAFTAGTIVVLALVAGAGVATWQAVRARQAELEAKNEAAKSTKVAHFVTSIWGGAGAEALRGRDTSLLKELLDHAAKRLETELADEPEVQAWLYGSLQSEYDTLNEPAAAEAMARKRHALLSKLHPAGNANTTDAVGRLAIALASNGNAAEAEKLIREALSEFRPGITAPAIQEVFFRVVLADVTQAKRDFVGAAKIAHEALAVHRRLLGGKDGDAALAETLDNVAQKEEAVGNMAEAERLFREALVLRQRYGRKDGPRLAESLRKVAFTLLEHGADREAEPLLKEALSIQRSRPESTTKYVALHRLTGPLSRAMVARGDFDGAERLCRDALAELERNCSPKLDTFGVAHMNLAAVLKKRGNLAGAEAELRAEHVFWVGLYGPNSTFAASALVRLSQVLKERGETAKAEEVAQEAVNAVRQFGGDQIPLVGPLQNLARLQNENKKPGAATASLQEVLGIIRRNLPVTEKNLPGALANLAEVSFSRGDFAEAARLLDEAVAAEHKSPYVRMAARRTLYESCVKLYTGWAKTDPSKSSLAKEWQAKLDALESPRPAP